ncbi:MAG: NFACT family protein [Candidatus Micrarchaeia archaeon]
MAISSPFGFRALTNIDLFVLSNELQLLKGSRVRKIYQYGENEFRINFSVSGRGSVDVVIILPYTIHITKQPRESSKEPSEFAMVLRKHLENRKVEDASQWQWDRLFVFKFSEHMLIAEFFGKGNLILLDSERKIITSSRQEETRVRKIKRGEKYFMPEDRRNQPDDIPDFAEMAARENDRERLHLIAFLSRKVNLPPFYWEEILFRIGAKPLVPIARCDAKIFSSISKHAKDFIEEVKRPSPILYHDGAYSVVPLKNRERQSSISFPSFSELMDKIYSESTVQEISTTLLERRAKVQHKLMQQRKHWEELLAEVEENQKIGNLILENGRKINSIVEEYEKMKGKNLSICEIEKRLTSIFCSPVKIEKGMLVIEL